MRLRALQMPIAVWLLFATVLTAGTVSGSIRLLRPADGATWRTFPSSMVVQRMARADRAALCPGCSAQPRSKIVGRARERKAAATLLLLMLGGRDRLAAVPQ